MIQSYFKNYKWKQALAFALLAIVFYTGIKIYQGHNPSLGFILINSFITFNIARSPLKKNQDN